MKTVGTAEAAAILNVSIATLQYWASAGIVPIDHRTSNGYKYYDLTTLRAVKDKLDSGEFLHRRCKLAQLPRHNQTVELAKELELNPQTVRDMVKRGEIECHQTEGGHYQFTPQQAAEAKRKTAAKRLERVLPHLANADQLLARVLLPKSGTANRNKLEAVQAKLREVIHEIKEAL